MFTKRSKQINGSLIVSTTENPNVFNIYWSNTTRFLNVTVRVADSCERIYFIGIDIELMEIELVAAATAEIVAHQQKILYWISDIIN